jgi:hypothetical protein
MNLGIASEIIRQEAVERAMARYRASQAVERARQARGEQRRITPRGSTGLGHGTRRISREEAVAKIAKTHPRSAWRLLQGYFGGRTVR